MFSSKNVTPIKRQRPLKSALDLHISKKSQKIKKRNENKRNFTFED